MYALEDPVTINLEHIYVDTSTHTIHSIHSLSHYLMTKCLKAPLVELNNLKVITRACTVSDILIKKINKFTNDQTQHIFT